MDAALIQSKLKVLFEKIKEPGYVMNNYYADGLINKLSEANEPDTVMYCKMLSQLADLITAALEDSEKLHPTVQVFLIRLLAITVRKELYFAKIFNKREDVILKGFKDINSPTMNTSLRVAYMEIALALVTHDTGTLWLLEKGVWKEILSLCSEKQTVFVVRQTYKFASLLVWKLNDTCDEANVRLIINHIIKPMTEVDMLNINTFSVEQEENLCKIFEPMLHILLSIVTVIPKIQKPNFVTAILTKENPITSHLYIIIDRLRKESIMLLLGRLMYWLLLAKMFLTKPFTPEVEYTTEDFIELSAMYFNMIQTFVMRRSATVILDFCTACNVIWLTICKEGKLRYSRSPQNTHNQLMFLCLVPVLVYIKEWTMLKSNVEDDVKNERFKQYLVKMLNSSCEHIARSAYALRDLMLELDGVSITMQSVKRLTCLKNLLNDEQANLVFQALFYILNTYDPTREPESVVDCEESQEKMLVMSYVLDTVDYLVKSHNINWHESLEIICLYNVVYNILKRPNLSCKFIVTALNVIATTIKKFLPPNLSLLMESKPGSSIHELGKLIYMKMHDMHWEVRDSALELLLVCTEISYIKFPPFQKQILENNLINVAATIAFNDHEYYVQASALKCVGAACKMSAIWDQLTAEYPDIQDKLLLIVRNNQEGVVRKEACNLFCEFHSNIPCVRFPPSFKNILYEHMVSTALTDFHWEVQLSALKFWRRVIQASLTSQGMLDGTFPPVTFSKETRKIVTLNENEIQKRLIKILDELASVGCLTVLVKLLHEDIEVDIMDAALSVSLELIDILDQYKVPDIIKPKENDINSIEELNCEFKNEEDLDQEMGNTETEAKSENVIEGILNTDDMNLLSKIYESHLNLQTVKPENSLENNPPKLKLVKLASPYLFINHVKSKDFKAIADNKRKWNEGIRSLSSLLDDVLGIYEMDVEFNTLDCY